MVISITFEKLLNLLKLAKKATLDTSFYHCVAYDKKNGKFDVYNVLFLNIADCGLVSLYEFNPEEHSKNLAAFNCVDIINHALIMNFCQENKIQVDFVQNNKVLKYKPHMLINEIKTGQQIKIFCTGLLVDAEVIEVTENSLTAKHRPIRWGNDIYTQTTSLMVQTYTGQAQKMIPHCFLNDWFIYA